MKAARTPTRSRARAEKLRDASIALPFLGAFLLSPPIMERMTGDLLSGVVYMFSAWAALIMAAAALSYAARRRNRSDADGK